MKPKKKSRYEPWVRSKTYKDCKAGELPSIETVQAVGQLAQLFEWFKHNQRPPDPWSDSQTKSASYGDI